MMMETICKVNDTNNEEDDDVTWTPSLASIESNDSDDEDNCKNWKESPMKPFEFIVTYNQTDIDLEQNYVQEVFEVKKRVLDAAAVLKGKEVVGDLSANDIFNIFLPTNHIFDMMTFMNTFLINKSHERVVLVEMGLFF